MIFYVKKNVILFFKYFEENIIKLCYFNFNEYIVKEILNDIIMYFDVMFKENF